MRPVRIALGRSHRFELVDVGRERERFGRGRGNRCDGVFHTRGDSRDWGGVCFTHAHAERDRVVLHGRFYVAHVPSKLVAVRRGRRV